MKKLLLVCIFVLISSMFVGAVRPVVVKLVAVAKSSTPKDGIKECLINKEGKKISAKFENVSPPDSKGNYMVFDGWHYSFFDRDNSPMFGYEREKEYQFDWAEPFVGDYTRVKRADKWGILKYDGTMIWLDDFYVGPIIDDHVLVGNQMGTEYFHRHVSSGLPAYSERYKRAGDISERRFYALDSDDQYYLVSIQEGHRKFGPYQKAWNFENGYAPVMIDGKWNFVERTAGKLVLEKGHDQVFHISEGKAIVWDDGQGHGIWSCIDITTQKVLHSNQAIAIEKSFDGIAIAQANFVRPSQPMTMLIDSSTGERISDVAKSISGPDELGYYCLKLNDYQQYLFDPKTRQQVYPPLVANKPREYVIKISGFKNGYCAVINNEGDAFHISPKWVRLYETNFDDVSNFSKVEIQKE